jgi:hypothetical protein
MMQSFAHPDALPADAAGLFADVDTDFYATADWWRTVIAAALPAGAVPRFVVVRDGGAPAGLFALQSLADGALCSLTTPYTCLYRPRLAAGLDGAAVRRVGRALAGFVGWRAGLRLDSMEADWPALDDLCAGLRRGGLVPLRFDHFGNWHEDVAGLSWARYLASRDGTLRETIRRRTARIARDPQVRLELLRTPEEIATGIAAFEAVYAKSWKEPEPYPEFNASLMRMAAGLGVLRLGVMWQGETPVAVQFWIVTGPAGAGRMASVLKLAHDEAYKPLSPGTVLTAWMIRRLLDDEQVGLLDFGRGDDPYKKGWAGQRHQRIGLMLANPLHPAGLAMVLRHLIGRAKRLRRGAAPLKPQAQ